MTLSQRVAQRYAAAKQQWWKYTDQDGQVFLLPEKVTGSVHSPYTGRTFQAHPEKYKPGSAAAPTGGDIGERIKAAFKTVSERIHRKRIMVSDLQKESKVPLKQLHDWLDKECTAHRANPSRGEYTAATQEEKDAALMIDGEPHLYIELF